MAQTYRDFELIIFDDGSEDHSREVIAEFESEYSRVVRYLCHENGTNRGIVSTYRAAISRARGKYVAFLEHDDRWSNGYLDSKVALFDRHPEVGVVFSPYRVVSDGWFGKDMVLRQWLLRRTFPRRRPFSNFGHLLRSNNIATFSCFAARKSILDQVSAPPLHIFAYDWWVLAQLSTKALFFLDDSSYTLWRWSRDSTIGGQQFEDHRDRGCAFMGLMYRELEKGYGTLAPADRRTFDKTRTIFSKFVEFYRRPGALKFLVFFVRAPVWALATSASLVINYAKFGRGR